jgi:hypothetical protein
MIRLSLILVLFVAGCAPSGMPGDAQLQAGQVQTFPRVALSPQQLQLIYAGVQRRLTFPASARFGGIVAGRQPNGSLYVCGSVDTRTSAGTYTGNQPFYGTLDQRGFKPTMIGGTPEQVQEMTSYCRQQLALS